MEVIIKDDLSQTYYINSKDIYTQRKIINLLPVEILVRR